MSYEKLLSPMKIGNMTVKNRVVMTAAEMGFGQMNGKPTEMLMDYYEERAKGGVGLIIPGTTRVNDGYSASTYTQLAMSHDYHIEPMREFAKRIHSHGAKLCIQLHHAGRQGYSLPINNLPVLLPIVSVFPRVKDTIFSMTPKLQKLDDKGLLPRVAAPSVCEPSYHVPSRMRAMSKREVKKLVKDFVASAERCKKADVDAVELHSAHGYIIQQFLSPNTNHRTDEYGGCLENRMRFLLEIIAGIRERCGDYPIVVRLTVDEMYDRIGKPGKGYGLEEGKLMAKRLEKAGVDSIDVTSAAYDTYNYWLEPSSFEPGWRAYLAKEIKGVVKIPVIAANFIRSPDQAEKQLEDGIQDFIGSARSFICDPHWVKKVEEGCPNEIKRCIGCLTCIQTLSENAFIGTHGECALNPTLGIERKYSKMVQDGNGRIVVVVGAGPAGLMAAETLAKLGFKVTVLEKEKTAGGQINIADSCILKDKLGWCIEDLMVNVIKLGVEVKLETDATADMIMQMNPYAVIVATGGTPVRPGSIKGIDLPSVFTAPEIILRTKELVNKNVVVIGSGITGLETTEILNECGNHVTVVEMADTVAPGTWFQVVDDEMTRISSDTVFLTGKRLMAIKENEIEVEDVKTNVLEKIPADNVVLSLGVRPANKLYSELSERMDRVYAVGDAKKSGRIAHAVHGAFDTAMEIR